MNIKSEINIIQKQLLARLNVKTGSTMFTIIEAISRQAFAKASFVVSQKNSTLAEKAGVTASTISRNLKKIKDLCGDLLIIEQNRNCEERFASLVFTFIPQQCQTVMTNGEQTEPVNDINDCHEIAESTSSISSTNPLVLSKNNNKDLNTNNVKQDVQQEKIIFDTYLEFKTKGIDKKLFNKVLEQIKNKRGIKNFKAYLRGALSKVVRHIAFRKGELEFEDKHQQFFYDWLNDGGEAVSQSDNIPSWLNF